MSEPGSAGPLQHIADAEAAWRAGDRTRARELLEEAAARFPQAAVVCVHLGVYALLEQRNAEAASWLESAVQRDPADAAAWNNLGVARLRLGRAGNAATALRRALDLAPRSVSAMVNLGNALELAGEFDDAVSVMEAARQLDPANAEIRNNLGNLYKVQGLFDCALAEYDAARRADPEHRVAWSNLLALTKVSTKHSASDVFDLHRAWAARFEPFGRALYVAPSTAADPERQLRIGYLSPDCHTALPAFLDPVIAAHDRRKFEVFAYFNNAQPAHRLASLQPIHSRVLKGLSDDAVAAKIRTDGIDVLIDIAGHTGHNRLGVLAQKPAPLQLTWLDYLGTTGLDAVDFRLTDAVADPPGLTDEHHSEALLRFTRCQWCWHPPTPRRDPGPAPMTRTGNPTFGSFNHPAKLTDETLALWSRALATLPDARLVVVGVPDGTAQRRVLDALGRGASRARVLPRLAPARYREEAAQIDVALDPRPFSGATTTLEMLWQGVPVATWPGETSASRSSASLLTALELDDWIASDAEAFLSILSRASSSPGALSDLRRSLPGRLAESTICDVRRFVDDLERHLRKAWHDWCTRKRASEARPVPPATGEDRPPSSSARFARARLIGDSRLAQARRLMQGESIDDGLCMARELVVEFPEWQAAQHVYLQGVMAWARSQEGLVERTFAPPSTPTSRPRFSVVICSIDPSKYAAVCASYRQRFAGWPLEILGVHDARSLAEGYNRAAARATGDVLVFSHDDIDLVSEAFAPRLAAHLERFDGVGVAGASRVVGPKWGQAGFEHIHGHILHPPPRGKPGALLMVSGFQGLTCSAQVLDGVFIAVRRSVWEVTRFDPERYDGFHLYDMDFTARATDAGASLAVALDLTLFHRSTGRYDAAWRRYANRFVEQRSLDPFAASHLAGTQVRIETQGQLDLLRAALLHLRYGAR